MNIPSGEEGVRVTLGIMAELVAKYKIHPLIRETCLKLIADLKQKDYDGETNALFQFVKFHIRYVRDIHAVETVQTPIKTLEYAAGDCDDKSTLLATMLASIGYKTRFRAMGFTTNYCHVIVEALLNGKWVSLDTTEPEALGWLPDNITMNMYRQNRYTPRQPIADEGLGWITAVVGAVKGIVGSEKSRKAKSKKAKAEKIAAMQEQAEKMDMEKSAKMKKIYIGAGIVVLLTGFYLYANKKRR